MSINTPICSPLPDCYPHKKPSIFSGAVAENPHLRVWNDWHFWQAFNTIYTEQKLHNEYSRAVHGLYIKMYVIVLFEIIFHAELNLKHSLILSVSHSASMTLHLYRRVNQKKKAERRIFSTLRANSVTSLDKASSAEENATKIIKGIV